jgi:hypothetical protein
MVERKIRPAPLTLVPRRSAKSAKSGAAPRLVPASKLFVLDTNVLMHDPTSLFRFEEHDIYLPILTLEELDNNKKGVTEVARNARQVSRFLDELVNATADGIGDGIPLAEKSGGAATGRLYLQTEVITTVLPASLANGKADNQILAVVMHLQHLHTKRSVILVSKDINMRIKARALGIAAEDYFNDKVLEDTDLLYSGMRELPGDFWDKHGKGMESWQQGGYTYYRVTGPLIASLLVNEFLFQEKPGEQPFYVLVKEITGRTAVLQTLKDYTHQKNNVVGDHRAQPRAELRAQPAHEPRDRLHLSPGTGRHGQDAADARRGPHADARAQGVFRDHHDARHRSRGRGHRLPARDGGGKDEPVDGRAGGQSRRAQQDRRRCRRVGPRRDARPHSLADQGEEPQLHARPHVHQ